MPTPRLTWQVDPCPLSEQANESIRPLPTRSSTPAGSPSRRKDPEDALWRATDSLGRDDLLLLAKVADAAHIWICQRGPDKEAGRKG